MATFEDIEDFKRVFSSGALTCQKHPTEDLFIFNYSREAARDAVMQQFNADISCWDHECLRKCRGLITDRDFNFVARPFEKFFNLEELKQLPKRLIPDGTFDLPFTITEKMDGSLGIMYWTKDGPALATRSTFTSEQAIRGTKILREKYGDIAQQLPRDKTFLFEIVYPENKMVVNYGDVEDLYLLAVIDTETGREEPVVQYPQFKHPQIFAGDWHDIRSKFAALGKDKNREGFVVRFANGFRVKLKFENYFKLHYYSGKLSKKYIIKMLAGGEKTRLELDEIHKKIEAIDEEFVSHIDMIIQDAYKLKKFYLEEAKRRVKLPGEFPNKFEWSAYVLEQHEYAPLIFKLCRLIEPNGYYVTDAMRRRDEASLDQALWKLVEASCKNEIEKEIEDDC